MTLLLCRSIENEAINANIGGCFEELDCVAYVFDYLLNQNCAIRDSIRFTNIKRLSKQRLFITYLLVTSDAKQNIRVTWFTLSFGLEAKILI